MGDPALKIVEPMTMSVRRVGLPDLQDKGRWLCDHLRGKWPHLQDRVILGWLQGITGSNEYLFVRSEKAFALFQRKQEFIDPYPLVHEVFVLADVAAPRDPNNVEAVEYQKNLNAIAYDQAYALYDDAIRWAQSIRAARIYVGEDTPFEVKNKDEAVPTLKKKFGRLFEGLRYYAKFEDPLAK